MTDNNLTPDDIRILDTLAALVFTAGYDRAADAIYAVLETVPGYAADDDVTA